MMSGRGAQGLALGLGKVLHAVEREIFRRCRCAVFIPCLAVASQV